MITRTAVRSGGGGSGSSFPGAVKYFSGVAVNKVDLDDAITGPTSFGIRFKVPDPAGTIAGGLSTTSTGLEFTDGTNTATLTTSLPASGDDLLVGIQLDPGGSAMGLYLPADSWNANAQLSDSILKKSYDLQSGLFVAYGGGTTAITGKSTVVTQANANSGIQAQAAGYIPVVAGDIIRVSADVTDASGVAKTLTLALAEMDSPYASSTVAISTANTGTDILVCHHVATMPTNLRIRLTSFSTSASLAIQVANITVKKISGQRKNLISFGDSICATAKNATHKAYTEVFCEPRRIPYENRGVGSETLTQIAARFDAQVRTPSTIMLEGGANDIFNASTDPTATMQAKMQEMITKSLALASEVWVFTVPYCGAVNMPANKNGWRTTHNNWLKTVPGIRVINLDVPLTDGAGNQVAGYYESGDLTHPNTAGHAAIVAYMGSLGLRHRGDYMSVISTVPFDGTIQSWES